MDIKTMVTKTDYSIPFTSVADLSSKLKMTTFNDSWDTVQIKDSIHMGLYKTTGEICLVTVNGTIIAYAGYLKGRGVSGTFNYVTYAYGNITIYQGTGIFMVAGFDESKTTLLNATTTYMNGLAIARTPSTMQTDLREAYLVPITNDIFVSNKIFTCTRLNSTKAEPQWCEMEGQLFCIFGYFVVMG